MFADAIGQAISAATIGWVNKPAGDDYWYGPRGGGSVAGVDITEDSAMSFTTVFACVKKLAGTVATLPIHTYERTGLDQREPVQHEIDDLLNGQANEDALGLTIREAMMSNVLLWGNGYWEIIRSVSGGSVLGLHHLESKRVKPMRNENGVIYFEYRPDGAAIPENIPSERILHVPGLTLNGITGLPVVAYNRLAISLGLAATKFGASFFGNGAWAGGFIKRPADAPPLSEEAGQRLLASLNEKFRGPDKAFGFGLLREGMDIIQLEMPFEDAMFLDTRRFTREDICGMFDVPPSKIQDHTRSTFSNVEHLDIAWVKDSILPWCVRIESAIRAKFYRGTNLYSKHNLAGLMRGDFKTRMDGYAVGILNGVWSINDVRRMEDMNPIEGGNEHYRPLNVAVVGQPIPQITGGNGAELAEHLARMITGGNSNSIPDADGHRERLIARVAAEVDVDAFRPMVADACRRIATKECKALTNAWKRRSKEDTTAGFMEWLSKFYREQKDTATETLSPIFAGFERAGGVPAKEAATWAAGYVETAQAAVESQLEQQPEGLPDLVEYWQREKAEKMTDEVMTILQGVNE